jgi:hypothetical protein
MSDDPNNQDNEPVLYDDLSLEIITPDTKSRYEILKELFEKLKTTDSIEKQLKLALMMREIAEK